MTQLYQIKVSEGNSKMGALPSISLVPGRDCGNCAECVKDCFAIPKYKMYKAFRANCDLNSATAHKSLRKYFWQIGAFIAAEKPAFFRFHVAGDILSQRYLGNMAKLARRYPGTRFLAFTKMHGLDFSGLPENLAVLMSMFPTMAEPANDLPRSWFQRHEYSPHPKETRIPESAMFCPGDCEHCGLCWNLPKLSRTAGQRIDVWFMDHGPRAKAGYRKPKA